MNYRRRHILWEAATIAALLLMPLLFWWRLWTPNPADRVAIPAGDLTSQYYPLQSFAARELAAGRLPAWDPYLNAGQPGLADIQTGFYYPLNLIPNLMLALLGWPFSLGLMAAQVILHFMLAGLFTYLFVRQLARRVGARPGAARFAGAISALSFTYAGYLTSFPVQQITILETAIWLPLVLFFLDRAAAGAHRWPSLAAAGIALAMALLAGHPQTALYVVYMTLAYGIFLAVSRARSEQPAATTVGRPSGERQKARRKWLGGVALRSGFYVVAPLVVAGALAAAQLWPTLQFIARSTRAGLGYDAVASGFPLAEVTHFLYPGYFGSSPQYLGILTPILAAAAFFLRPARRQAIFWLAVAAIALLLAFGGNTFLYSVAYLLAPGFGAVRDQERVIFLFSFAASVLAGYGALTLLQPIPGPMRKGFRRFGRGLGWALAAMSALTALFYAGYLQGLQQAVETNLFEGVLRHHTLILIVLAGAVLLFALRGAGRGRRGRIGLALGLIWLNLFTVNWRFNQAQPEASGPFPTTGLVAFLKSQPGTFRISSAGLLPGGSSAGSVYRIEDITGNTPLRLDAFQQMEDKLGDWRRWQLLNVQYVVSRRDLAGPGLELAYEEDKLKVYRVEDPLPRAWVVYRTATIDDSQALAALDASDFDARNMAVIPPGSPLPILAGATAGEPEATNVVEAWPGHLVLDVAPASPGVLVVSQLYYTGWQATVDGQPVPVSRIDYALQGLPLQAGAHRVALSYRPTAVPAAISLATLAGCVAGLALHSIRSRQAHRSGRELKAGEQTRETQPGAV